jgi:hypothetical protein
VGSFGLYVSKDVVSRWITIRHSSENRNLVNQCVQHETFELYRFSVISTEGRNSCPKHNEGSLRFLVDASSRNDKFKCFLIGGGSWED